MCSLYVSLTIEDLSSRTSVSGSATWGCGEDTGFLSLISQLRVMRCTASQWIPTAVLAQRHTPPHIPYELAELVAQRHRLIQVGQEIPNHSRASIRSVESSISEITARPAARSSVATRLSRRCLDAESTATPSARPCSPSNGAVGSDRFSAAPLLAGSRFIRKLSWNTL